MNKKLLSAFLAVIMLMGLLVLPVAAVDNTFALKAEVESVQAGQTAAIAVGFGAPIESNTAILNFCFDDQIFDYVEFSTLDGITILSEEQTQTGIELVCMIPSYATQSYGTLALQAKSDAGGSESTVQAEIRYVIRSEEETKQIQTASAVCTLTITEIDVPQPPLLEGDTDYDGDVDILDLSNMIDWMGITDKDPAWAQLYHFFDFNDNGEIDTYDISYVASLISYGDGELSFDQLLQALETAKKIDTSKYTEPSVQALAEAIAAAEAAIETATTQQALNDATAALHAAIAGLIEKGSEQPPVADKAVLDKAIADASLYQADDYTPETYTALEKALEEARAVQEDGQATQDSVDAAVKAIENAIAGLAKKESASIKSKLIQAIADAEAIDPSKFTDESAAALARAIEDAKAALESEDQATISAAVDALNEVIAALEPKPNVDKTALAAAIADAEGLDKGRYTDESVAALNAAVDAAKSVQADEAATQEAVDAARKSLENAIEALEEKPFRFVDVQNEKAFYFTSVYWAYDHDPQITNGVDATHFVPDDGCTRGQVVTFLWRAAGCPEPKGTKTAFTDLKAGAFYEKAVAWAVEEGITNGMSATSFAPNNICTRGQTMTFLWRFCGKVEPKSTAMKFTDVNTKAFYTKAVAWAVENGITIGMTDTTFVPNDTCTRGQIVTFLYRTLEGK